MVEHKRTGWVDACIWRFSRLTMLLPGIIVVIMMLEVFMRYILEKPTIWVNEMSLWMGGWAYLTAGLYAMQQRSHIRIFILYDIMPLKVRRLFDCLSTSFIVLWCAGTVYGGSREAWRAFTSWERFGTAWDPPIPAITQPLILIVMLLMAIQALSNLIMDWQQSPEDRRNSDKELNQEVEELKRSQKLSGE